VLIIPEHGVRISRTALCPDASLDNPRRGEMIHEFVKVLCFQESYRLLERCVNHARYQGMATGRMTLECITLTEAEYGALARECYEQGLRDGSREDFYKMCVTEPVIGVL